MTFPAGVETCTVTFGKALGGALGKEASIIGTVKIDRAIVWAETGDTLYPVVEEIPRESVDQSYLEFDVPFVDQAGFIDGNGDEIANWAYTLEAVVTFPNQRDFKVTKNFQVFEGQSSIDLDLIPGGSITPGVTAPSAAVLAVAGETGIVTAEQLMEALRVPLTAEYVGVDLAPASNTKRVIQTIQSADAGAYITSYDHTQIFDGTRDPMFSVGYNYDQDRSKDDDDFGAFGWSFEGRYEWDSEMFQEWYLTHIPKAGHDTPGAHGFIRPLAFTVAEIGEDSAKPYVQGHLAVSRFQFLEEDMATEVAVMDANGFEFTGDHHVLLDSGSAGNPQLRFADDGTIRAYLTVFHSDPALYLWDAQNAKSHVKYTFGVAGAARTTFNSQIKLEPGSDMIYDAVVSGNSKPMWQVDGATKFYQTVFRGDPALYIWNAVNARAHAAFIPGSSDTTATTELSSNLKVKGGLNVAQKTPASAAAAGAAGDMAADASYIYVCTATNTWKRVAVATW